jgi:competence protein ComEA
MAAEMLRPLSLFASILCALVMLLPTAATASSPAATLLLAGPTLEGQLNLNTATAEQLDLLPGVGPATAAKIISHRERHPFERPAQLMRIKGIGKKKFAKIRPYLVVEGETTLHVAGAG